MRPEFKLLFEAYTRCHPKNMVVEEEMQARNGWWNGINILVRDPAGALDAIYPATDESRILYVNEHVAHAARLAAYAPEALDLISVLRPLRPFRFVRRSLSLMRRLRGIAGDQLPPFEHMNTYSDDLPAARFNPSCAS